MKITVNVNVNVNVTVNGEAELELSFLLSASLCVRDLGIFRLGVALDLLLGQVALDPAVMP